MFKYAAVVGVFLSFVGGVAVGVLYLHYFPRHNYQKFGDTPFLVDTTSGKLCNPFKESQMAAKHDSNQIADSLFKAYGGKAVDDGEKDPKLPITYIPGCGE